ncbi:MAG TPA: AI-2E family transporter [Verrucomicrobiae bacterium]|nr:AI-2E family transporter [Verrucomicrobiae bacterium]
MNLFNKRRVNAGARFLLVAACFVVVVQGLKVAAPVLLPFALAMFLAILSLPLMWGLKRHRLPDWLAILLCVLVNVAVLGAVVLLASQSIREFQAEVPKYRQQLVAMTHGILTWLTDRGVPVNPNAPMELIDLGAVLDFAHGTVGRVAILVTDGFLVLIIMIFILAEATVFGDKLRAMAGRRGFDPARLSKIVREVQQYLGIKTGVSLATGTLAGTWVATLGLDLPILWGLVAFVMNYIPTIGWVIGLVPPLLLGLFGGLGKGLLVAAGYIGIHVVLTNFVEPTLLGRKLGLSTLVVVLSLLFWGWVWGPIGMLLSVPLTMMLKIALENTDDLRWVATLLAQGRDAGISTAAEHDRTLGEDADDE